MDIARTVYSIYYPETQRIVENLWKSVPHDWYTENYTKKQNEMHTPYLNGWREWVAKANVRLGKQFRYDYPTNGASEGIQHLMTYFATHDGRLGKPAIHVFEGEYEGYRKIAEALNLKVYTHSRHNYKESIDARHLHGDVFWTSQPSAIDGNVWLEFSEWVRWMNRNAATMPIIVDLTYVGAVAKEFEIDLTSPNIKTVLWSLSKPFGVYYHRVGGLASAIELPTLYGNYWFKNLFSLHLGVELMKTYGPHDLPRKYLHVQDQILTNAFPSEATTLASDVVILANKKIKGLNSFNSEYVRVKNNHETIIRYCLTPGMDKVINNEKFSKPSRS